jgi:hypothetical protein
MTLAKHDPLRLPWLFGRPFSGLINQVLSSRDLVDSDVTGNRFDSCFGFALQ